MYISSDLDFTHLLSFVTQHHQYLNTLLTTYEVNQQFPVASKHMAPWLWVTVNGHVNEFRLGILVNMLSE